MIIWIDAQLSPALARWIHETFRIEAQAVRDLGLRNAKDPVIFKAARAFLCGKKLTSEASSNITMNQDAERTYRCQP